MKRKIVAILTGLMIGATAVSGVSAAALPVQAAKLADGTESPTSVFVYCFVRTGTTSKVLVMDCPDAQGNYTVFNVILDKNTVFNNVKRLTPTDQGAAVRDIIGLDIYLDSKGQWRAADIQVSSLNNQKFSNSVEVGTSLAQDIATASTNPSNTSSSSSNVKVVTTVPVVGTVMSSTTSDMLYLDAGTNGKMTFKLDETTDMSNGKVLIPGYKYRIEFYNGGDGYNHVARVIDQSGNNVGTGYGVNTSNPFTVSGTVKAGTVQNVLYLSTTSGDMIFRIDATSDTSKCHVLKEGQEITVVGAGGPDGYNHVISLTDKVTNQPDEGYMGDTGKLTNQVLTAVYGTFADDSTDDVATLGVNGTDMKVRLDSGSKGGNVPVIVPGWSYSANLYYGSDGYWHVQDFNEEAGHAATKNPLVNTKSKQNFTGTVQKNTVANKLYLKMSDGNIAQIKLDMTTNPGTCKVLREGKKITAACVHGYDGYWHATSLAIAK